jgi:nucleolar protein 53
VEERRVKEAEKLKEVKNKIDSAVTASGGHVQKGVASGMTVDEGAVDETEEGVNADGVPFAKKIPERKTKQQKAKAARLRAEVCCSYLRTSSPHYFLFSRNAR